MDLAECKRKGLVRPAKKNRGLAKSLLEMSMTKENAVKDSRLSEKNISAYIPMAYDSLREVLEAICIMHGYKVTSHVCIEKLLVSIHPWVSFREFDRFRHIRNSINYYGKKIGLDEGREIINKIFLLKKRYIEILKALLK
jgi:hypothetical protein